MLFTEREKLQEDVELWLKDLGRDRGALLPVLQKIDRKHGHISDYSMQLVAEQLNIFPSEVYSVVSFFRFLYREPHGKFIVRLCRTISCDLAGKDKVAHQLQTELGIMFGETTDDNMFTLEWTNCTGMCDQGPAMLVNDHVITKVTPERIKEILDLCKDTIDGC